MPAPTAPDARPADAHSARRPASRAFALVAVVALAALAVAGVVALSRAAHGGTSGGSGAGGGAAGQARPGVTTPLATADLLVTRDFGATRLARVSAPVSSGTSVLTLLQRHAKVETAYGGGFVNAIDGLTSGTNAATGERADWFFYVNGRQSGQGASDVVVTPGMRIWWDYRSWDKISQVPAVVGQYPAPFVVPGQTPQTVVEYAPGSEPAARVVTAGLEKDHASVTVRPLAADAPLADHRNHILVGRWSQLVALPFVRDAADHPTTSGVFARSDADGMAEALDVSDDFLVRGYRLGAVLATARSDEPTASVWLVTGANDDAVKAAAGTFGSTRFDGSFGVLVLGDGDVLSLPVEGYR